METADRDPRVTRYSHHDVLRILHLQARQIAAWERAGLITRCNDYSFEELGRLRTLRDLRATRISAKSIRRSIDAMQRVAGMRNPLMEATAIRSGARLIFRHGGALLDPVTHGALLDPVTQQLAFDFAVTSDRQLQVVSPGGLALERQALQLQEMFQRAVQLEGEAGDDPPGDGNL